MKIRLFDWDTQTLRERTDRLTAAGYIVDSRQFDNSSLKAIAVELPRAVVINLERRPSHGRDIALALRKTKATRYIPLVLLGGENEKVLALRHLLPDAVYTSWDCLEEDLARAIASPPVNPVVPKSLFDPYVGTPLPKKLGIRPGMKVGLLNPPNGFEATLGELPEGVILETGPAGACDVWIWFVTRRVEYEAELKPVAARVGKGSLWVSWPKQASGMSTDLTQPVVRAAGLAIDWVDFKICAIDAVWTGLCFRRRK